MIVFVVVLKRFNLLLSRFFIKDKELHFSDIFLISLYFDKFL